jgi:hypothetical protein
MQKDNPDIAPISLVHYLGVLEQKVSIFYENSN